jgi:hypothetical protein
LKKRSKKLSSIAIGTEFILANSVLIKTEKSFLVLFCKKEHLTFFLFQWVVPPGQLPFFQKRNKKLLSVCAARLGGELFADVSLAARRRRMPA